MIDRTLRAQVYAEAERIAERVFAIAMDVGDSRFVVPSLITKAASHAIEDLEAFARRDAAAAADPAYVYESYSSFRAVLAYRVAHLLYRIACGPLVAAADCHAVTSAARRITENAKVETGVEIHPAATIGRRFVIDHGSGTVIGEQVEIGDDCYILHNVILGGRSIGYSSSLGRTRRHPRIGSRVEIGAQVMVLGPVTVGDDCRLEPGARVTTNVPPNSRVRVISTLQITVAEEFPEIHGMALMLDELVLCGSGLTGCLPVFLDEERNLICELPVQSADDVQVRCRVPPDAISQVAFIGILAQGSLVCYITPRVVLNNGVSASG